MEDIPLARLLEPVIIILIFIFLRSREIIITILVNHVTPRFILRSYGADIAGQMLRMVVLPVDNFLALFNFLGNM